MLILKILFMKKIFLLISLILVLLNCRNQDSESSNPLVGQWKLIQTKTSAGNTGFVTEDFSSRNIVYDFKANNTLTVTGSSNEGGGYSDGNYSYQLLQKSFPLNPNQSPNIVKISLSEWTYAVSGATLSLNTLHVDGSELIFQKIK